MADTAGWGGGVSLQHSPSCVCDPPHTVGMIEGEQVKKEKTPPHFEVKQKKKRTREGGVVSNNPPGNIACLNVTED